jgi:hypothetical protein
LKLVEKKKCWILLLAQGSKLLAVTQFCHISGVLVGVIIGLCHGVTCVIPAPVFDARMMWEDLTQER